MSEVPLQPVGGLNFRAITANGAVDELIRLASSNTSVHVHLANAYTIALAGRDDSYRQILVSGHIFADGKPITWVSRLLAQSPGIQQIRGPQLFLDTLELGQRSGIKHYFIGGTAETLAALESSVTARFPKIKIAGMQSPPFRRLSGAERETQDSLIAESDADIVWVGLGTPKQDFEARRLALTLGLPTVAVGAAFGFAAGTTRVAPLWMQRSGFEWAFRLISEPRRLWKRYLFGNIEFLRIVWRERNAGAVNNE